jgi:hypothetical protein
MLQRIDLSFYISDLKLNAFFLFFILLILSIPVNSCFGSLAGFAS